MNAPSPVPVRGAVGRGSDQRSPVRVSPGSGSVSLASTPGAGTLSGTPSVVFVGVVDRGRGVVVDVGDGDGDRGGVA